MPITNISDTARWVAVYRAMESERPDAIFHDPFARRLAGEQGEHIVRTMKRGRQMAWAMIVRTAVFDEIIMTRVRNGVDMVVNLAAGLDARPWRLALPSSLRWVDVDLPEILQYKTDTIGDAKPACEYEAIHTDLTDANARLALLTRLAGEGRNVLVVTEGLLIYLTSAQVGALASDLHTAQAFRWWLIDLANPMLLKIMQRSWGKTMGAANAPFQFAPAEGTAFFRPFGWGEMEFRPSAIEAERLRREMSMMWFWRFMMRFAKPERRLEMQRMSGIVLLERTSS